MSTEEQSREGVSLEMQAAKIRAYCMLNDLELTGIVEDAGISGKSIKGRPGVQSVLDMVRTRIVDALIIYKLDSLARNTAECLEISKLMDKSMCALHSITEKLDTSNALGRLFFTLTAALAEMERGLISERTTAALAQKRAKGEKTGGDCPYGYTAIEGRLVPSIEEQRAISRIRSLRAEGCSLRGIVAVLQSERYRTRKGTLFSKTQVGRILRAA